MLVCKDSGNRGEIKDCADKAASYTASTLEVALSPPARIRRKQMMQMRGASEKDSETHAL